MELDRVTFTLGSQVKAAPSQKSLGDRSISPQRSSHRSLSLSIERTDVVETI
jgi:hypothetical protein